MKAVFIPGSLYAYSVLKPNEEIVCTNATVIVDKMGNLSWVQNDKMYTIFDAEETEKDNENIVCCSEN